MLGIHADSRPNDPIDWVRPHSYHNNRDSGERQYHAYRNVCGVTGCIVALHKSYSLGTAVVKPNQLGRLDRFSEWKAHPNMDMFSIAVFWDSNIRITSVRWTIDRQDWNVSIDKFFNFNWHSRQEGYSLFSSYASNLIWFWHSVVAIQMSTQSSDADLQPIMQ